MLILICDRFEKTLASKLADYGEVSSDASRLEEATVALIGNMTTCDADWLDRAENLQLLIRGGVGLDNIDVDHAKAKGVAVHNTAAASAIAVAEMAFSLMIGISSRMVDAHASMAAGQWEKSRFERTELSGKTLGIIGPGTIGGELASRAKAFGMKAVGYHPSGRSHPGIKVTEELADVLAGSHYISLHMPLDDRTRGMVDARFLGQMRAGAGLINTARGEHVVEADIVAALESGHLGAYAADVFSIEPLPADSPLRSAARVILTPHTGSLTAENMRRIGEVAAEIIERFID